VNSHPASFYKWQKAWPSQLNGQCNKQHYAKTIKQIQEQEETKRLEKHGSMSMHRPASLTANPPPPFRPNTPDPLADRASPLHRRLSTIRSFIAREQMLFGGARVNRAAAEERVEALRQRDQEDAERVARAATRNESASSDSGFDATNPSIEAVEMAVFNENGFDGWHGPVERTGRKSEHGDSKTQSQKGQLYENLEAAAEAAIDNAAE
jgi:hypothetical protein